MPRWSLQRGRCHHYNIHRTCPHTTTQHRPTRCMNHCHSRHSSHPLCHTQPHPYRADTHLLRCSSPGRCLHMKRHRFRPSTSRSRRTDRTSTHRFHTRKTSHPAGIHCRCSTRRSSSDTRLAFRTLRRRRIRRPRMSHKRRPRVHTRFVTCPARKHQLDHIPHSPHLRLRRRRPRRCHRRSAWHQSLNPIQRRGRRHHQRLRRPHIPKATQETSTWSSRLRSRSSETWRYATTRILILALRRRRFRDQGCRTRICGG